MAEYYHSTRLRAILRPVFSHFQTQCDKKSLLRRDLPQSFWTAEAIRRAHRQEGARRHCGRMACSCSQCQAQLNSITHKTNMQTIETKYFGPGNVRGSRIKATSTSGLTLTQHLTHETTLEKEHYRVAQALADKLNWECKLIGGETKRGMIFVLDGGLKDALRTMIDHAGEAHPHFESERGQRDIQAARDALLRVD